MKKIFALLLFLNALAFSACAENLRVIPYHKDTDPKIEGASSAPANINHKPSKYKDYDENFLAVAMKTKPNVGTNAADMAAFFKSIGWEVDSNLTHSRFEEYDDFKNFVLENISAGTPILVENVEWGGHWRVIFGYDDLGTDSTLDDVLIMADPYDTSDHNQDGYVVNNGERFFSMWFDHYMLPPDQREQPFVVARPKK